MGIHLTYNAIRHRVRLFVTLSVFFLEEKFVVWWHQAPCPPFCDSINHFSWGDIWRIMPSGTVSAFLSLYRFLFLRRNLSYDDIRHLVFLFVTQFNNHFSWEDICRMMPSGTVSSFFSLYRSLFLGRHLSYDAIRHRVLFFVTLSIPFLGETFVVWCHQSPCSPFSHFIDRNQCFFFTFEYILLSYLLQLSESTRQLAMWIVHPTPSHTLIMSITTIYHVHVYRIEKGVQKD